MFPIVPNRTTKALSLSVCCYKLIRWSVNLQIWSSKYTYTINLVTHTTTRRRQQDSSSNCAQSSTRGPSSHGRCSRVERVVSSMRNHPCPEDFSTGALPRAVHGRVVAPDATTAVSDTAFPTEMRGNMETTPTLLLLPLL